jgi:death on curing protein
MRFITVDEAIRLCEQETGSQQLRDFNLLDSAVARPQNYVTYEDGEPDIHTAAAHLLFGIISNHPFVDGNKRVGLKAAAVFYILNGWELDGEDSDVYALVLDVAEGSIDVAEIAQRLNPMVRKMEVPDE